MNYKFILILFCAVTLFGCANKTSESADEYVDTFEPFNRAMFKFNYEVLDPYLLRPASVIWTGVVPKPVRKGIIGVASNISEPGNVVYNVLQGKVRQANISLARFMINTLFGFGGLIDVASMADPQLKKSPKQSLDDVLETYNVPKGKYIVAPFYPSNTVRSLSSNVATHFLKPYLNPVEYALLGGNVVYSLGIRVFAVLESRSTLRDYEQIFSNIPDPYAFMRNQALGISSKASKLSDDDFSDYIDDIDN